MNSEPVSRSKLPAGFQALAIAGDLNHWQGKLSGYANEMYYHQHDSKA
jgi:hypothetical protein